MFPLFWNFISGLPWTKLLTLLIDVTAKGAAICAVAGVATILLRRSSAYLRNMVWVFALVGLIILPAFSIMAPVWNLPIIPGLDSWGASSYQAESSKLDPGTLVGPPYNPGTGGAGIDIDSDGLLPTSLPWYAWSILAWICGGVLYLCWCMISHAGVRNIVKKASPVAGDWNRALVKVSSDLDLTRKVRLLESSRVKAAITTGIFNPVVILPADSRDWTENRRCLVLSHELAHVKRWDTLIELFALLATVVYWFNPLVWFAVKQLRIERERDCDDAVLCAGARPSDYAELLMKIASDLGGESAAPVWQLSTISQGSNLKDRLMSILNPKIDRRRGGRRSAIVTGILVLSIVLPLSASGIWNTTQAQEQTKKEKKAKQAQIDEMKKKEALMKKEQMSDEKIKAMKKKKKMDSKEAWMKLQEKENSAAALVGMTIKKDGLEAGEKMFKKCKQDDEFYFDEKEFNSLGYIFLGMGKPKEAITVFKMNVKEYPDSWNVYDSLGEAYLSVKKVDAAEKYYTKALEMNPEAKSAVQALEKIKKIRQKEA